MSGNSRVKTKLNLLDKVPFSELEALKVKIFRKNVTQTEPILPFEWNIDDPKAITVLVHSKKDSTRKSVFDREGILVNQYDENVTKPQCHKTRSSSRSRSSSSSLSRRSSDWNRKSNNDRRPKPRSRSREKDRGWSKDRDKSPATERRKYSSERGRSDRDKSVERRKDYTYNRDREDPYRGRSRSPQHYRRRSTSRGREDERRRRSRSLSRSRYVPSTFRKSASPKYHKSAYHKESSRSPNRADKIKRSKYGEPSSRRSRSPDREKRELSRERHRFSRSPTGPLVRYDKERRKSRSPNRSPHRYDKYSRRSRSPHRYDAYKGTTEKRSSRSPRKLSSGRPDYKHARSPEYDRERRYRSARDRRSKSRSPKTSVRSPHRSRELDYRYYEGFPGTELWIPGALPPGYPIPRFYPRPTPFFPRQPIVIPPQVPLPYQPYRPRYPIYNSKYNTKPSIQNETAPKTTSTDTNATRDGTVVVQEVEDDKSNKETEKDKPPEDAKG